MNHYGPVVICSLQIRYLYWLHPHYALYQVYYKELIHYGQGHFLIICAASR